MRIHKINNLRMPDFNPRSSGFNTKFPGKDLIDSLSPTTLNSIMSTGVGIEIEVEKAVFVVCPRGWFSTKEGSLRDHGIEFVSKVGLRVEGAYSLLESFLASVEKSRKSDPDCFQFTERTSIHIHLDCSLLSEKQIQALLVLYTLVEGPLFEFGGNHRKYNVFCVPFRDSIINHMGTLGEQIDNWEKYSALNLKCLRQYGTVEFRIMEGTIEIDRIYTWILLLSLLHHASKQMSLSNIKEIIRDIKSDSQYREALKKIFYGFVNVLHWSDRDLDSATVDCKLLLEKMER